jgi:Glycosyl hydrolase family 79 C-terminal beta domain
VKLKSMAGLFRRRYVAADLGIVGAVALLIAVLVAVGPGSSQDVPAPQPDALVTVEPSVVAPSIPAGFLGLSVEYSTIVAYVGRDPNAANPVFLQLVRNLTRGQPLLLRIGGDSSDTTWWPVPGMDRPAGVKFTLTPHWIRVTRAMTDALDARLILGINLEADSTELASTEARELIGGLGAKYVRALELGNEPELYATFPYYRSPDGQNVPGRTPDYDFSAFLGDFTQFADALPQVPLAGPAIGGVGWTAMLDRFLAAQPRVGLVTLHRYPLQKCFVKSGSPTYPTVAHLLTRSSSKGLAEVFAQPVSVARRRGLPLRVDELNTVSCGAVPKVSQTFASALWALDTLFEMARVGVEGVNIHTFPGAGYALFRFSHRNGQWRATVAPEYYGLQMFADAAPPGSRIHAVSGRIPGTLEVWATSTADGRQRILLINQGAQQAQVVGVRTAAPGGKATVERLRAPGVDAHDGVTLGGQSYGASTTTGRLAGAPERPTVATRRGAYVVTVPAASAALLTVSPPSSGAAGA